MEKRNQNTRQVIGLIGVGLDNKDGQTRITQNEDILVCGGSAETHEHLQDVSIRFNEYLRRRGKRLPDAEADEVIDLLRDAMEE